MFRTNVPARKLTPRETDQTVTHVNGVKVPPFTFHHVTVLQSTVLLFTPDESDIMSLAESDYVHVED